MPLSKKLKRTLTAKKPKLKLNLNDIFDQVPQESDALKEAVGGALLDKIRERAKSGTFLEQSRGAQRYSDEYSGSFEFKVFGKSKSNVNLTASGDMLRQMDIVDQSKNTITLGWENRTENNKAHGHITGAVGKTRDFFGVTDTDIEKIRKEFQPAVNTRLKRESGNVMAGENRRPGETLMSFLRRVLGQGEV